MSGEDVQLRAALHRGAPAWLWRAPPGHHRPPRPGRRLTDELSPGLLPGRRPARWDSAGEYLLEAGCARVSDSTDTACVSVFSSLWGFQGSREAVTGEGRCLIRSLPPWILIEPSSGGWVGEQRGELEGSRRGAGAPSGSHRNAWNSSAGAQSSGF